MKVIKIIPRGYCHGVVKALNKVVETINNKEIKKPIYILGDIVHNKNITNAFNELGVITLNKKTRKEMLEEIDSGTVIITAHGIDYHLIEYAKNKGLCVVDATCSDVYKTHEIVFNKIKNNYQVIYIGKKNHPEPEGVIGIDPNNIFLVENKNDIDNLKLTSNKLCIINQTTMSKWDVLELMEYAKKKYENLEIINEICSATSERQEAVYHFSNDVELVYVVGDNSSNNSKKLVEVARKKTKAILINDVFDIDINYLIDNKINTIGVTSGASTPSIITKQVIDYLEQLNLADKNTFELPKKIDNKKIIPRIKM